MSEYAIKKTPNDLDARTHAHRHRFSCHMTTKWTPACWLCRKNIDLVNKTFFKHL